MCVTRDQVVDDYDILTMGDHKQDQIRPDEVGRRRRALAPAKWFTVPGRP